MADLAELLLAPLITANNRRMAARGADAGAPNPRNLEGVAWAVRLAARHAAIRAEWDADAASGRRLPYVEDVVTENQGDEGRWRGGPLVSGGRPVGPLPERFPVTMSAISGVPGLWSALWSVLEPGGELPRHAGPNAGVLRYHLGIVCEGDTALEVDGVVRPYREGEGILFDDTAPHVAWNRGASARVTLFFELLRPATGLVDLANRAVQQVVSRDRRYRRSLELAAEWDGALNPHQSTRPAREVSLARGSGATRSGHP